MQHFLYDICLFRWAKIGPIYLGNLFMFLLFFGGPIIFSCLNQKGYNIFEIVIWSFKYVISYIFNLTITNIVNKASKMNKKRELNRSVFLFSSRSIMKL